MGGDDAVYTAKGVGGTYSVLDAKLVSSCFSLPSSARPRFSRLLARNGVSVKTLQKVELGATRSLQTGVKERWWHGLHRAKTKTKTRTGTRNRTSEPPTN